jgi:hypothetical protein
MANCMFCDTFVGEEQRDGGCKGRTIGNKDICEQCLSELKYILESVAAKSPSERVNTDDEDEYAEDSAEMNPSGDEDPLSSGAKI